MAFKQFSKDYTSPSDQAWRDGKSPSMGTLGPNKGFSVDSFRNNFIADLRKNPDFADFSQQAFAADTAQRSQDKLNIAYKTNSATFVDDRDNNLANDFLTKYSEGVARGLVEEDRAIFPENLGRLVTENVTDGSNLKNPNTVNQFPGQSGVKV